MHETKVRRCRPLLDTYVEILVPAHAAGAIDPAFAAIAHIHAHMSFNEEASDLTLLRKVPAGEAVRIDCETVRVLRMAAELHAASIGLFDVTVATALVAARFLPRPAGIDLRRMTGTASDIEILDDEHVRCRKPLLIDLGGIAKGYAIDRAVETLQAAGVSHGLVNAGGDLRVFGPEPQTVHLRGADGRIEGAMALTERAMASSNNRHLRRTHRGRETSPHRSGNRRAVLVESAVTVVAPRCVFADALTKIVLADPMTGGTLLPRYGGILVDRTTAATRA
jgi:FAD:protein FMN transferase